MKKPIKKFVIKKYIMATSALEALKKERKYKPDDCWVDEEWSKNNPTAESSKVMGFKCG